MPAGRSLSHVCEEFEASQPALSLSQGGSAQDSVTSPTPINLSKMDTLVLYLLLLFSCPSRTFS
jgi:hypothetical protein